jgi:hypothetical protein
MPARHTESGIFIFSKQHFRGLATQNRLAIKTA